MSELVCDALPHPLGGTRYVDKPDSPGRFPEKWEEVYQPGDEDLPVTRELHDRGFEWQVATRPNGTVVQPRQWYTSPTGNQYLINANGNITLSTQKYCNAACTFCAAEINPLPQDGPGYFNGVDTSIDIARQTGLHTVAMSGGEPTLYWRRLTETLDRLNAAAREDGRPVFDEIALHTQGTGLLKEVDVDGERMPLATALGRLGLTHISISRLSHDAGIDSDVRVMRNGLTNDELKSAIDLLHAGDVRTRLYCEMLTGITEFAPYLDFAEALGVTKVHFAELFNMDGTESTDFARLEQYKRDTLPYKDGRDTLAAIPGVELVSEYTGNIVREARFLRRDTAIRVVSDLNPDAEKHSIKQVLVYPDGTISYNWFHPGNTRIE